MWYSISPKYNYCQLDTAMRKNGTRIFFRDPMKGKNMQNAHSNSYRNKVSSPAIRFGETSRCFAASAVNPTNHYTYITPPTPFDLRIISIILHSTVSAIVSVGLSLLYLPARCLSVLSRAVFVVALGSHPVLVIPINATVVSTTVSLPLFVEYCSLMKLMRYLYLRVSLSLFIFDGLGKWERFGGEHGEVGVEANVFNSIPYSFSMLLRHLFPSVKMFVAFHAITGI